MSSSVTRCVLALVLYAVLALGSQRQEQVYYAPPPRRSRLGWLSVFDPKDSGVSAGNLWRGSEHQCLVKHTQTLDLAAAKVLAKFASAAYCEDHHSVSQWKCSRCQLVPDFTLTKYILDEEWDVSGYMGYYAPWNAKIIVFRGTHGKDLKNWIQNLKASQHQVRIEEEFPGFDEIRVHNGFSEIWSTPFKPRVLEGLDDLIETYGRDGPLYITGHSAGGATAQLAAFTIKWMVNLEDIRLWTYGSPRVGNWEFASMLSSMMTETWRFTHDRDIVPILPWISMGFWHSAQEVFQKDGDETTTFRICDGTGEDPKGHNSMCRFGCTNVHDHYHYLQTIMENDGTC